MLKTIVKKGSYHDSVVLMLLTNQISAIEGVKKVSIMMATPANKDIYRQSGLSTAAWKLPRLTTESNISWWSPKKYPNSRPILPTSLRRANMT